MAIVATDLFILEKVTYLLVVDYYSRYVKVVALPKSTSSLQIIQALGQVCKGVGTPTQHQQPAVSTSEWRSGVSRQDSEKYPEEGAGSNGSTAGI